MKRLIAAVAVGGLLGCSATVLTAAGRNVRLEKSDAPKGCTEIGVVSESSSNLVAGMEENVRNKMRNAAAERGANYVRLESYATSGNGVSYTGTAYKCPPQ